ncbi:MAG: outer membrane beta-barrel protein [Bacteroidia bacterium]|nr:outer membrane beta-barrel protein [Bacteroidia bacterium]
MKKLILALSLGCLCCWAGTAYAQKGFKLGVFALPQASGHLNADDDALEPEVYDLKPLWGMGGGIDLGYNFSDYAGIRLNAIYAQQGTSYLAGETRYTQRLEYLRIPLMIGFNTEPADRKVVFSLYAGAQMNLLTQADMFNDNPADQGLPESVTSVPTEYSRFTPLHYAAVGDVGVDINLPPDNLVLTLRLRADYSFQDVENKNARLRITESGATRSELYWRYTRGTTRNAETFALVGGLRIGLTYTFARAAAAPAALPEL